jgi:hypothetical protein
MRTLLSSFAIVVLAGTGCALDTDERPAEFSYIAQTILEPGCATATCHNAMTAREGFDFSSVAAARKTFEDGGFVTNLDAPRSNYIIRILTSSGESRMPIDSPLPDADIALIEAWIAAGATY